MSVSTEFEVRLSHPVSMQEMWTQLEGRAFVLGVPNAKGQHIMMLGDKRWFIEQGEARAGDRVRVTRMMEQILVVERIEA